MPLAPRWKLYDTNIQHIGKKRRRKKQRKAFSYRHLHDPDSVCPGGMVDIDLVKSLVNFFFKIFDGYITGSLGPAGSQIRKIKILNNFFYFAFRVTAKNSA